jgi:hypothetical protein
MTPYGTGYGACQDLSSVPSRHKWRRGGYGVGLWEASLVPWVPELFSAPVLATLEDK